MSSMNFNLSESDQAILTSLCGIHYVELMLESLLLSDGAFVAHFSWHILAFTLLLGFSNYQFVTLDYLVSFLLFLPDLKQ